MMKSLGLSSTIMRSLLVVILSLTSSHGIADTSQAATISPEEVEILVATCTSCHGVDGVSPSPALPNLAGQKAGYLANQIQDIRDGVRIAPAVFEFVKDLTDAQITALSEHYASLPDAGAPAADSLSLPGAHIRGKCISCHGVEGRTVNEEWPNLAGQKKQYLEAQLLAYRSGDRVGHPMNNIARMLDEQQIKDVAEYYSQTGK